MELTSVKVLQKEVTIVGDDGKGEVTYTRKSDAHKDFVSSMELLHEHYKNICEEPIDAKVHVNGFSLFGAGETMSVIIKGHKILTTDKISTMNTPKTSLSNGDYEFERKLSKVLTKVVDQAKQYLSGKVAPTPIEEEIDRVQSDSE